ncbi:MAG: redoxin family protein [Pirellulales bacterium]
MPILRLRRIASFVSLSLSLLTGHAIHMNSAAAAEPSAGKRVSALHLPDYRGRTVELSEFEGKKVLVVAFLGVECPLAQRYSERLAELAEKWSKQSVAIIAVDSNAQDTLTEMASHARRHSMEFPFVKDGDGKFAASLGASRTPEVFVLDAERTVRYQGRIDDQFGIGYVREKPSTHELSEAVEALLDDKPVLVSKTTAVGCIIGKVKEPKADASVTYSSHIARIFRDSCVQCHRDGEIGPFAMSDYASVAPWADMIAEVVREKRMPPWHADPKYGKFANDCSLSEEECKLVQQWVDAGAPEGDPSSLPEPKHYVTGWQLEREPDLILNINPKPFQVPADGEVKYQYFRVDPGFTTDKWVRSAQILPGNHSVVHHVLAFARDKNAKEPLGAERGYLFGYVPGAYAEAYPKGIAKRIPAGSELIFQVHYTPVGTPQTDASKIGFIFMDESEVEREVITTSAVQVRLDIPPHEADYKTTAITPETLPDCELLTLAPHMHLRGKAFRYTAIGADGSKNILLDIPRYDFNWQTGYRTADPLKLSAGTKIFCEAVFDNSEKNLNNPDPSARVRWGDQTTDEMMIGYFDIVVPKGDAKNKVSATRAALIEQIVQQGILQRLDANKNNKIERSEVPARWQSRFDLLDQNSDGVISEEELGKPRK